MSDRTTTSISSDRRPAEWTGLDVPATENERSRTDDSAQLHLPFMDHRVSRSAADVFSARTPLIGESKPDDVGQTTVDAAADTSDII